MHLTIFCSNMQIEQTDVLDTDQQGRAKCLQGKRLKDEVLILYS